MVRAHSDAQSGIEGDSQEDRVMTGDVEYVAVDTLTPHPENAALYGEPIDVEDLVASIEENGFDKTEPIESVRDADHDWPADRIVSGHRRHAAAQQAGLAKVPIRIV
jgi:ParB-like chromosome segregation protein Spo0J